MTSKQLFTIKVTHLDIHLYFSDQQLTGTYSISASSIYATYVEDVSTDIFLFTFWSNCFVCSS